MSLADRSGTMSYMNTSTDSVRVVLFDQAHSERFLILAETDDPTNFKLPGGKFDHANEPAAACAERELREELGLEASRITLTPAAQLTNQDGVSTRYIYGAVIDSALVRPSAEIELTQWVSEAEVPGGLNRGHILSAVAAARAAVGQ